MIVIDIHSFSGFVVMKIMKRLDDLYVLSTYLAKFNPMAIALKDELKKGDAIVLEISPRYFSTWDYRTQ